MIAERDRVRDLLTDERRADRHAAAERLADRDEVRLDAERGEVERIAGAAEAALHFVGDEQRAGLRARFGDRAGEGRRQRPHAAFALDRFGDHRGGRGRHRGFDRGRVVDGDELHRRQQRLERRAVVLVGRDRQRSERAAVERLFERDELGARLAAVCQ